ncbi:BACON domain-containing protein [Granulicella arctica]|uniref:BACON domain-containing protein n=1 Tax=Granulicella arctica TaxID=940613 RepID=UPI0021E04F01|nr:BACON domain-containing protein [Granulicella arctica]
MFPILVRSSRFALAGAFASLLVLSSFGSLHGQVAASSAAMVQTANARLTAEAQSGLPLTTETRSMLVARHTALVSVFMDAPSTARSYALPAATREELVKANPAYAALIEQEKTITGQLTVAIADNFRNRTSQKVYSLYTAAGAMRVSFAAAPASLSALEGRVVTVNGLGFPEILVADRVRPATRAEADSSIAEVSKVSRLNANAVRTNAIPPFTGPGITTTAPPFANVTGPQSAAVIIVDFASTPMDTNNNPPSATPLTLQGDFNTQAYYNKILNPGSLPNVSDYIAETSYGKASYAADVYGPFVLSTGYNCAQTNAMLAAALQAAVNAGLDTSKYNRFVFPFPSTACTYDGLASTGFTTPLINHEWTWVAFPVQPAEVNNTPGFAQKFLVMSHEFGHNLGMNHSNTIDFGPTALGPIDFAATNPGTVDPGGPSHPAALEAAALPAAVGSPITGINDEYGDPFPIMAGVGYTPYNAEHRYSILGWIGADGEKDVTASGTFSVAPTENTTGLRALHVLRDAPSNSWIWVEFHQPNSTYTNFGIPYLAMPNTFTSGAELLYSTSYLDARHTYIIDTTPSAKPNNFADAILGNGLSWSDPYSLLTITSGSQTNSALGVTVSYDTACATPALSTSSVPATAGSGTVTVTAAAGCAWTVSSNAAWITITNASGMGNGTAAFT